MTLIPLGDPNQLTARLEIPEDMIERFEAGDRRHKLGWSTIHALAYRRDRFPGATLTTQYRSHMKIGSWLSGFYDFEVEQQGPRSPDYLSRVVIGVKEDSEPWAHMESQVEMQTARVALITCAHEGLRRDRSIYATDDVNRVEIWKTIEILMQVVREWKASRQTGKKTVLITTPYRDQKERVQEAVDRCADLWRHWVDAT
jgi:hypothetical protein